MQYAPETVLKTWLNKLNIRVSATLIKKQLKSHPDYPSLASITDVLDHLSIENCALEIKKDELHEIPTPFLAHLKSNGGEFVIVENRDILEQTYPGFFKNWDGIVVVTEKPENWEHRENEQWLQKERKENKVKGLLVGLLLTFPFCSALFAGKWTEPLLLLIALAGLFISWLISTKELGTSSKLAEKVCGKKDDCGAVIGSPKAKLLFGVTWGDIGVIWFFSLLIAVTTSVLAGENSGMVYLLSLFSAASIAFIFFSVYYQWRVEKKWCRLCLITISLLCAQLAVLFAPLFDSPLQKVEIKETLLFFGILLAVSTIWFSLKHTLVQNAKLNDEVLEGIKLKRNDMVFQALLEGKRKAETHAWKYDLQMGKATAPLQVLVACNTYCGPCAHKHEKLHTIMENYGDKMGLTIRFAVTAKNKDDKRTKSVQHILQHIEEATESRNSGQRAIYTREVLHQWFKLMDLEKFIVKYPCKEYRNVDDILATHEEWMMRNKIEYTPTIFINGRELPGQYNIEDIPWLINIMETMAINSKATGPEAMSIPV